MNNLEYEYIEFGEIPSEGKTKKFICTNKKSDDILGKVRWYPSWRQYCFFPAENIVFSKGCLNDITDFLEKIKKLRNL